MAQQPSAIAKLSRTALLAACLGLTPLLSATNDPFLGFDGPILPNPYMPFKYANFSGMLAGDFNEDGFEDLALVGGTGPRILLGNGDCTFSEMPFPSTEFIYGLGAIGDLNEDGHQDLVFAGGHGAKVLLGNGDGTFGAPIQLTVPPVGSANDLPYAVGRRGLQQRQQRGRCRGQLQLGVARQFFCRKRKRDV